MSETGVLHLVFSFLAIGAGGWVLLIPKGTRWHRTIGHLYGMSMLGVIVTALAIYDLTGTVGPFHVAAAIALVTLTGGMYTVLRRRPKKNWIEAHAVWMSWSYIGLMAAFVAESMTRFVMPRVQPFLEGQQLWGAFWTSVAVGTFVVCGVGARLVKTRLPAAVAKTPQIMRRERARLAEVDAGSPPEAVGGGA